MKLLDCVQSPFSSLRHPKQAVCMKMKISSDSGDNPTIIRLCHWEDEGSPKDACRNIPNIGKIEFCETCTSDGCNKGLRLEVWKLLIPFLVFVNVFLRSL